MRTIKRNIIFLPTLLILSLGLCLRVSALSSVDVISEAAVLMDAETGQVLFSKNGDKMMLPASTTKIVTGLLVAESCEMKETAAVSESAVDIDEWDSANIGLVAGEKMTVGELMYAMMLPSANDAANVLAEHVAGNQRDFAQKMTERARLAGATSTHFSNAHGLPASNHYTTARDLALITRAAIKNPIFMQYFSAASHICPPTNKQPSERRFANHQIMLSPTSGMYDPSVIGGKVGYTHDSQHTMSTAAVRNGRTLICVVMRSPNRGDKFLDTKTLFDFGFNEFSKVTISKEKFAGFSEDILDDGVKVGEVDFLASNDFTALIHNEADPGGVKIEYSHGYPFEKGESVAAHAIFTLKSPYTESPHELGRVRLEPSVTSFEQTHSLHISLRDTISSKWWFWPFVIFIAAVLVFAVLFSVGQINRYRQLKRRRARIERVRREREALYSSLVAKDI